MSVTSAKTELYRMFPGEDVDAMVQAQPLLLIEDVADAISELQRCGAAECSQNLQVFCNQASDSQIWLILERHPCELAS